MQNDSSIVLTLHVGKLRIKNLNKQLKLSMFLNLAKKSAQVKKQIISQDNSSNTYHINQPLSIKYEQLNLSKHKFCVIFIYEIRQYQQKICLGYTSLNIFENNKGKIKEFKILQCQDPNATVQLELKLQYLHNNVPMDIYQGELSNNYNKFQIEQNKLYRDSQNLSQRNSIFHLKQSRNKQKPLTSRCRTTTYGRNDPNYMQSFRKNNFVHLNDHFQTNSQQNNHERIIDTIKQSKMQLKQCIKSLSLKLDKKNVKPLQTMNVLSIKILPFVDLNQVKTSKIIQNDSLLTMINRQQKLKKTIMDILSSQKQQIKINEIQIQIPHVNIIQALTNKINQYKQTIRHFKSQLKRKQEEIQILNVQMAKRIQFGVGYEDKMMGEIYKKQQLWFKNNKKNQFKIMEAHNRNQQLTKMQEKIQKQWKQTDKTIPTVDIIQVNRNTVENIQSNTKNTNQIINNLLNKNKQLKPISSTKRLQAKINSLLQFQGEINLEGNPFRHLITDSQESQLNINQKQYLDNSQSELSLTQSISSLGKTKLAGLNPLILKNDQSTSKIKTNGYFIDFMEQKKVPQNNRSQKFLRKKIQSKDYSNQSLQALKAPQKIQSKQKQRFLNDKLASKYSKKKISESSLIL